MTGLFLRVKLLYLLVVELCPFLCPSEELLIYWFQVMFVASLFEFQQVCDLCFHVSILYSGIHQFCESYRRDGIFVRKPFTYKDTSEVVEESLQWQSIVLDVSVIMLLVDMVVVEYGFLLVEILVFHLADLVDERFVHLVDDRRVEPFKERWVGAFEEAQGFLQIPAGHVCFIREHLLDGILFLFDMEVPLWFMDIDEAYIPIAVRR